MEIDNIDFEEKENWNSKLINIVSVLSITFGVILGVIIVVMISMIDEMRPEIEQEFSKQDLEVPIDKVISIMKVFIGLFLIPIILNIIGSILMMKKSNNGWILFLVSNVIIMIFFLLGTLSNPSLLGFFLVVFPLTMTFIAAKNRYQKPLNTEEYSN